MTESLGESLFAARRDLSSVLSVSEAERDVRRLMCHVLGLSAAQLMSRLSEPWPTAATRKAFMQGTEARFSRQPLSQIIGYGTFFGREFTVSPDVLTPRPDTETLVEIALSEPFERVLDLGTGSSCILATLLAERPNASGVGTDLSDKALTIAAKNLVRHGLSDRATLLRSDWFGNIVGTFDLIVSNPPYIARSEMQELAPEVRDWEPELALCPGEDGLEVFRILAAKAVPFLRPRGRLIVEIGFEQGNDVKAVFFRAGLDDVTIHSDINAQDRVVSAYTPLSA